MIRLRAAIGIQRARNNLTDHQIRKKAGDEEKLGVQKVHLMDISIHLDRLWAEA